MNLRIPDFARMGGDALDAILGVGAAKTLGLRSTPKGWSGDFFDTLNELPPQFQVRLTDTPNLAVVGVPLKTGTVAVYVTLNPAGTELVVLSPAIVAAGGLPLVFTASRAARSNSVVHWRLVREGRNEWEYRAEATTAVGDAGGLVRKSAAVAAEYADEID